MNMKKVYIFLAVIMIAITAKAGSDDFGVWTGLSATKTLPYGFSLSLEGEFRSSDKAHSVDEWNASIGLNYKVNKYLKIGTAYVFKYAYSHAKRKEHYKDDIEHPAYWNGFNYTHDYWTPKNRFNFEATGDVKLFDVLKISLRERYQFTDQKTQMVDRTKYRYKNDKKTLKNDYPLQDKNEKERKYSQYLRSRMKLEFDKKGWDFQPYITFELFNNLDNKLALDKTRFSVGTAYKINRQNEVSLGYLFNNEIDEDPNEGRHVLNIGYSFKF